MDICKAHISDSGICTRVTREKTEHRTTHSVLRSLTRASDQRNRFQVYALEESCIAIRYDGEGRPRSAQLAWLSNARVADKEMLALLGDVWRAATLSAQSHHG